MEQDWEVPPQFRDDAYARLNLNDHTLSDNLPPLQPKPENGQSRIPTPCAASLALRQGAGLAAEPCTRNFA
jgi:hypothetical protein